LVDELDSTNRGEGGFGSTDTKQQIKNITELYEKNNNNVVTPQKKYIDAIKEREQKLG